MIPFIQKNYVNNSDGLFDNGINEACDLIRNFEYNPKLENISDYKKKLLDSFSDSGFVMKYSLGNTNLSINGIKSDVGLQIQLGNAARFYADMVKLQWFYDENVISAAIYVCFTKSSARESYASNLVTMERCLKELVLFQNILTLPVLVIGLDFINR
jgi:hypothetical protein